MLVSIDFSRVAWCGHCKNLAPDWKKVATKLKGMIGVAAIDASDEKNGAIGSRYGVRGFPTIKAFVGKRAVDYNGARDAKSIEGWAKSLLRYTGEKISNIESFENFLSTLPYEPTTEDEMSRAVLFTDKGTVTNTWKALSGIYDGRIHFGQVSKADSSDQKRSLMEKYEISSLPSIIVIKESGDVVHYKGKFSLEGVQKFLKSYSLKKSNKPKKGKKKKKEKKEKRKKKPREKKSKGTKRMSKEVKPIEITDIQFKEKVLDEQLPVFVLFYREDCHHCEEMLPEFEAAAKEVDGMAKFFLVNSDTQSELMAAYEITGVPTLKIFPGHPNNLPSDYVGKRTKSDLVKKASSLINDINDVIISNIKDPAGLQNFLSNSMPKLIVFTEKKSPNTMYQALALKYHKKGIFAHISSGEEELVQNFQVKSFPSIYFLNIETDPKSGQPAVKMIPFEGDMNFQDIERWLSPIASIQQQMTPDYEYRYGLVPELTSQELFDYQCLSRKGLCVIMFLDDENTEAVRNCPDPTQCDTIISTTLQSVATKKEKNPMHFMWMSYLENKEFADQFRVNDYGEYNLLVVHPSKRMSANYVGSYRETNIVEYLNSLAKGRMGMSKFDFSIPTIGPVWEKDEL